MSRPCEAHRCQICQSWLSPKEDCDRKIEDLRDEVSRLEYELESNESGFDMLEEELKKELSELSKMLILAETKNKCWQEKVNKLEQELKVEKDKNEEYTRKLNAKTEEELSLANTLFPRKQKRSSHE